MTSYRVAKRSISFFGRSKPDPKTASEKVPALNEDDVAAELKTQSIWARLDDSEIERLRNKSGLNSKDRQKYLSTLDEPARFDQIYQYKQDYVRRYYAKYGRSSGLKSGVCWPRREELDFMKQYDSIFERPLARLLNDHQKEQDTQAKQIEARDKEITKNLKQLEKHKKAFFEKLAEKERTEREEQQRKEKQIQEVREYLGYSIDPRDARFQEALAKKEEEEKANIKTSTKKNKHARLFEQLQLLIDSADNDQSKKISDTAKSADSIENEPQSSTERDQY